MKLLQKDLEAYRRKQYEKQNAICPLCGTHMEWEEAVLDHDHDEGNCRMVLHRNCNTVEGKMKKSFIRYVSAKGILLSDFIVKLSEYLGGDYSNNPIHPTELTPDEKELKAINKKLKTLKQETAIARNKARAKELRKLIKEERQANSWKPNE